MLRDSSIQKELVEKGFAIVGQLGEEELLTLETIASVGVLPTSDFFYSLLTFGTDKNQQINLQISQALNSFILQNFEEVRIVNGSYLAKPSNENTELLLHQDWCYTDEKKHQAYNVWIPLSDVAESNGALFFLCDRHVGDKNIRSGSLPTARIKSSTEGLKTYLKTVPMKRGEVLLFHPAVFHGSHPNLTSKHRVVITTTIIDEDAPFLYYHRMNEQEVSVFHFDDNEYLKKLAPLTKGEAPDMKPICTHKYMHVIPSANDLVAALISRATPGKS